MHVSMLHIRIIRIISPRVTRFSQARYSEGRRCQDQDIGFISNEDQLKIIPRSIKGSIVSSRARISLSLRGSIRVIAMTTEEVKSDVRGERRKRGSVG